MEIIYQMSLSLPDAPIRVNAQRFLSSDSKPKFTSYEKALNMLRTRKRNAEKLLYAVNNPEPKNYAELENYDDFLHALFTGEHLLANSGTSNHFVAENLYTKDGECYTGYGSWNVTPSSLDSAYVKAKSKTSKKIILAALELCKQHLASNKIRAYKHFITFTSPPLVGVGLGNTLDLENYAFSLLRKREYFKDNIYGAVIGTEFTLGAPYKKQNRVWDFELDFFHAHKHSICFGKWIDVELLKIEWTECLEMAAKKFGYKLDFTTSNGLAVVQRQTVWNEEKAIDELAKYVCSGSTFDDLPASEIIAVEQALNGRQMISTFGKCNNRKGTSTHLETKRVIDGDRSQRKMLVIDGKSSNPNKTLVKRNYMKANFIAKFEAEGIEQARIYLRKELAKRRKWRIDNFLERNPTALITDLSGNQYPVLNVFQNG